MIRGYRTLKTNKQLGWIRKIKRDFADAEFGNVDPAASIHFFGAGTENAALIIRQYVLTRLGGVGLNKALLYSIASANRPVSYPLPKGFQRVLAEQGFRVSGWQCSILWAAYIGALWCYGALTIAKYCYEALSYIARSTGAPSEPFVFFDGLAQNNLPQPCKDGRSHDIVTWYAHWPGCNSTVMALRHNVRVAKPSFVNGKRVEFAEHTIPPLINVPDLMRFIRWALCAVWRSAIDAVRGKWWYAVLLAEAAKAAIVRFASPDQLARDYLFHFSGTIYRPIWTYEAMKKGSRITCYFYSTSEEFKLPAGYEPNSTYWKVMNWPRYLVWDEYQRDLLLRSVGGSARIHIVGPIWFSDSPGVFSPFPENSIGVFDIQPIRRSAYFAFSTMADFDYDNPRIPMQFIKDIYGVASTYGGTIVHKRKRHDDSRCYKPYRKMLEQLSKTNRFVSIDPDISAIRVIARCRAVISMPFTSTAIMAKYLGKPSAYYDPSGLLQKDDRGAHGIPLLNGKGELQAWLSSIFNSLDSQSRKRSSHVSVCSITENFVLKGDRHG